MEIKMLVLMLVLGVFLVAAITVSMGLVNANSPGDALESTEEFSCSSCGNSCSAESNCGLSTCGAVNGGSCGCN
jgi:cytochrome c-type biogenesis protein CcmH/NrfF